MTSATNSRPPVAPAILPSFYRGRQVTLCGGSAAGAPRSHYTNLG